jgi:tRNA threonylcarbamoyl adenosine modification protein YeaZ
MKRSSAEEHVVMRLVLALEASSRTYAIAVGAGERPLAQRVIRRDDGAFVDLGELVAGALAAAEVTFGDIDTIAVDVGPGDVLSTRAAVAYANGLAFSLGVKIFAITSLELMASAAKQTHRGPLLCLKRGMGGNTYAGLFVNGEIAEMRLGPPRSIVPIIAAGLETICVAGTSTDDVTDLLPGVTVRDSGITNADVAVLYQAARTVVVADPKRLVPAASPVNEGSWIFHKPAASRHPHW